jgi:NAD(P)-dependent dehydrogenase (short-subunit alcohol dehydrogenase family)
MGGRMGRLQNKISIVTGAGSGIGRGIALFFAKEGARVVVADIDIDAGEETVRFIRNEGGEAVFAMVDVSKAADVEEMVKRTVNSFGKPDILCNNAGIMAVEPRFLSDISEEAWERTISINLKGVFLCCKYTLPEMMNAGGGSIINISSIAAVKRSPNYAYAASKGGIVAFTQSLALQYGEYNIRANAVCPGSITTPAREKARRERPFTVDLATRILKKEGTPEDIGHIAVYLASEESAYVTGSVFVVDGGSLRG